jgi:hypothetical protein
VIVWAVKVYFSQNCKDLGVSQDLMKFIKIPTHESMNFFFFYSENFD